MKSREPHSLSTHHYPLPNQQDLIALFNGIPEEATNTLAGYPGFRIYPRIFFTRTKRFVPRRFLCRLFGRFQPVYHRFQLFAQPAMPGIGCHFPMPDEETPERRHIDG